MGRVLTKMFLEACMGQGALKRIIIVIATIAALDGVLTIFEALC